ncbi:MAG: hypothetical protein SGARI_002049, partial [Bacillariaceae sp.]
MPSTDTSSNHVAKGSVLQEWTPPYLVVPLQEQVYEDSFSCRQLPRWSSPLQDYIGAQKFDSKGGLFRSPQLQRFLRRRRSSSSTSSRQDDEKETFHILCLLATLQIANEFCASGGENDTTIPLSDKRSSDKTAVKEDDDEDESQLLLMEAWPLTQEFISWENFAMIHHQVSKHLHALTLPHPLTKYAQKTIFELDENEYARCCGMIQKMVHRMRKEPTDSSNIIITNNNHKPALLHRLRASQLLLDHVANLPETIVGILLRNPLEDPTSDPSPMIPQSCLPNTCLELSEKMETISCSWIALYDLADDGDNKLNRTVFTRPKSANCKCVLCEHEETKRSSDKQQKSSSIDSMAMAKIEEMQHLAHHYFQSGDYDRAFEIYQQCHDNLLLLLEHEAMDDENTLYFRIADMIHSQAAVLLSQQKFAEAQRLWNKERNLKFAAYHTPMSEQMEKHKAYKYFDALPDTETTKLPVYETVEGAQDIFVTHNAIDATSCQQLIASANDYASNHGGWTTQRHYAVPTKDLPIHKVPALLKWFQSWMNGTLFPLLQTQFGSSIATNNKRRFYVHDAFL